MDIDALQDNLVSVAFCDINSEIYSQDFLTNTVDALKLENETIKKETDALKRRLDQQAQRLTVTRKECHRRRLLLLAQQQLMDSGPQSYHQCPHCPKAFINASFLNAHLYRRHVEVVTALQAIDLNQDHIDRSDKGGNLQKEKPAIDKSSGLTSNLEHQIQEVLGHIKTQPPSLPPTQLASAIVQTVEVNEGSGDYHPPTLPPAPSPTATWKKRTAELERQLQEERERMRELEERNRAWQTSVAEQHRVCEATDVSNKRDLFADVEHVREMFEVELRNLREENLQTQKELIQLRLKGGIDVQNKSYVEPKRKASGSPKRVLNSPEKASRASSSSAFPVVEMVNNANKTDQLVSYSWPTVTTTSSFNDVVVGPQQTCAVYLASTATSPTAPRRHSRRQQTDRSLDEHRLLPTRTSTSVQVTLDDANLRLSKDTSTRLQQQAPRKAKEVVVEGVVIRTEDEVERVRCIHQLPCAISTPRAPLPSVDVVFALVAMTTVACVFSPPKRFRSGGNVAFCRSDIELRIDPTEGVRPYKEQLEQLRQDPNALKRLRKEVEALLMEQLIDHDIQADARGLPRGKFNGTIDTLGQERQQLERKHPTFAEIRASLSRQVDRMALVALHSKRERREPLSGDGDGAASSSFKKPRASRSSERSISARPTSGRPASLTSITPTLSPIAERPRLAMVSPAMRRPNEAHSTQSLFEESEEEEVDSDVTAPVHK
ncbi:unnamed protein product [Mesocestoides corti]|uniref:C2H2-type domain-containing protein n=1 Tax=Mesocestoides corti TaxID=53468 RepID=A0A0R3U8E3_MESCO|nr:unnamed protein product [Mesocestoides corti]